MPNELWYWEKHVPSDLISAVKHVRHSFEEAGWKSGTVTQQCCYALLHPEAGQSEEIREYASQLVILKGCVGPSSTQYFHDLLKRKTPSAILKAFFHLYQEVMAQAVKIAFRDLLETGSANAKRLDTPPIDWAEWQVKSIINSASYLTGLWLKGCCDVQAYDSSAPHDFDWDAGEEEELTWTSWRAPRYASMQPSLGLPYEASRALEREDEESSRDVVKAFKQYFVIHLEAELKDCVGEARLALAKQPQQEQYSPTHSNSQQGPIPNTPAVPPQILGARGPAHSSPLLLKYRSEVKRAILIQLTQNPGANNLEICRALDGDGAVDLPKTWKRTDEDRLFADAYMDPSRRHKIEIAISRIRADLRKRELLPGR
jgi:hypothetical protein